MTTIMSALTLLALTAPPVEVRIPADLVKQWGLPKAETYFVYTADQHHQVTAYTRYQEKLTSKLKLKITLLEETNKDLKTQVNLYKLNLESMTQMKDFLWSTWVRCDRDLQLARAGSWWPWVVTAAVSIGGVVASSYAVYYRYRR